MYNSITQHNNKDLFYMYFFYIYMYYFILFFYKIYTFFPLYILSNFLTLNLDVDKCPPCYPSRASASDKHRCKCKTHT